MLGNRRIIVVVLWAVSIVVAAHIGARAQSVPEGILTGSDIGFKPTSTRDGLIFGTMQVKVNGAWRAVIVVDGGPPRSSSQTVPIR
jgi:hypothetical protein